MVFYLLSIPIAVVTGLSIFLIVVGNVLVKGLFCLVLIVAMMMNFTFQVMPGAAAMAAFGAMAVTILLGLVGTWRILGQKPAGHLRTL